MPKSTPPASGRKTPGAKPKARPAKKNARGRRQNHAARLSGTLGSPPPARPSGLRRLRGEDVRRRVLQAALECFGAFGFAGTSTRAVAEHAGVSHPLLIYHFQSKDRLWQATMEDLLGRYQQALFDRLASVPAGDAVAGLRAFIENFVEFSARTPQLHRIMTQQSTQGSERIHWIIDAHLLDSFGKICALIERAQRDGAVRRGDPPRLYYAVIGLGGTLFSVSSEFRVLTGRDVFTPEEVRETIALIFDFLFVATGSAGRVSGR